MLRFPREGMSLGPDEYGNPGDLFTDESVEASRIEVGRGGEWEPLAPPPAPGPR